jgi:cell volume regulation protein A
LMSMIVQGWTVASAATLLDLELPPVSAPVQRVDVDVPTMGGRDLMIYSVGPHSRAVGRGMRRLLSIPNTNLLGVTRDGRLLRPRQFNRIEPGDSVLVIAPAAQAPVLDELFVGQPMRDSGTLGEFAFDGNLPIGKLAEFYDFSVPEPTVPVGEFVQTRLGRPSVVGDRLRWETIEFVARGIADGRITKVGIDLEPAQRLHPALARLRRWGRRLSGLSGPKAAVPAATLRTTTHNATPLPSRSKDPHADETP